MSGREKAAWKLGVYGTLLAIPLLFMKVSPFTLSEIAAHQAIGVHCGFGELMGRVNIPVGQPGYHLKHDMDRDGVACEQNRTDTVLRSAGGARFVRPL